MPENRRTKVRAGGGEMGIEMSRLYPTLCVIAQMEKPSMHGIKGVGSPNHDPTTA